MVTESAKAQAKQSNVQPGSPSKPSKQKTEGCESTPRSIDARSWCAAQNLCNRSHHPTALTDNISSLTAFLPQPPLLPSFLPTLSYPWLLYFCTSSLAASTIMRQFPTSHTPSQSFSGKEMNQSAGASGSKK